LGKGQAKDFIASVFEKIRECLESGEDVLISGFGKLCVMEKKPRRGRNPQTDEDLMLGARRVVTFRCSMVLKEKLNGKG
jgi:integration host factor subunit alpha